jgi:hypothetical protein
MGMSDSAAGNLSWWYNELQFHALQSKQQTELLPGTDEHERLLPFSLAFLDNPRAGFILNESALSSSCNV